GLNYISGITMNTCFASSAKLPIAKLYSVIRIEDDLSSSSSYFYKEVTEIKQVINKVGKNFNSLILLDELFKGTNTVERIASAKAVLSHLTNGKNQILVSTHDIELTSLLEKDFDLYYFSESILGNTIKFDYKLKAGTPEKGNAIRVLNINGYPKEIINEASKLCALMNSN
ncbi:MAG: DNA mismatch repair protein MutS, partial [Crocinitomicaceae bacterium]|nr:DNA mismatch repair protein MutS [Crocinitomicaceae bacterium]